VRVHVHIRVGPHGQNLLHASPKLLNAHVCRLSLGQEVFLEFDQRLNTHTEDHDWGRWLHAESHHLEDLDWQELVVNDDATVECLGV